MGTIAFSQFGLSLRATSPDSNLSRTSFTNQTLFNSRLEARLDNYRRGLSLGDDFNVDAEVAARNSEVANSLAVQDPTALRSYTSLLSGLTYSRSARVVSNVEFALRKMSGIPSEEEAKKQTDKIVEAYTKAEDAKKAAEARIDAAEQNILANQPQPKPIEPNTATVLATYQASSVITLSK